MSGLQKNSCDEPTLSSSSVVPPPVGPSSSSSSSVGPSPVEPFTFMEFTAETYSRVCDNGNFHCSVGRKTVLSAFGPGAFSYNVYDDDGNNMLRQFCTHEDQTAVVCQMVGNHGNCLNVTTASNTLAISSAGLDLAAKDQPCSTLYPLLPVLLPNRTLDKCDYYTGAIILPMGTDKDAIVQLLVESGTNYPVVQVVKSYASASSSETLFASFSPEKPTDMSLLEPYPNVTVYDLRDGEGNFSDKQTFKTKKSQDVPNVQVQTMMRNAAIRQLLHMPSVPSISSFNPSLVRNTARVNVRDIPKEFDARKEWPNCSGVIGTIIDQFACESCWAMSSAAVFGDRMCIAQNSKGVLSPQYMVYCGEHSFGCHGSVQTMDIWDQLITQGTVSEECIPFTGRDGICPTICKDGSAITEDMIYHVKDVVIPWDESPEARVQAIQSEIMKNGPVQTIYMLFNDMIQYAGGIYQRTKEGILVGGHAVRIVGWGTEDGVDYWIVANSWGQLWGEGGFFRIRRGTNECNIESIVLAGIVN